MVISYSLSDLSPMLFNGPAQLISCAANVYPALHAFYHVHHSRCFAVAVWITDRLWRTVCWHLMAGLTSDVSLLLTVGDIGEFSRCSCCWCICCDVRCLWFYLCLRWTAFSPSMIPGKCRWSSGCLLRCLLYCLILGPPQQHNNCSYYVSHYQFGGVPAECKSYKAVVIQ